MKIERKVPPIKMALVYVFKAFMLIMRKIALTTKYINSTNNMPDNAPLISAPLRFICKAKNAPIRINIHQR